MLRGGNELVLVVQSEEAVAGLVPGVVADAAFYAAVLVVNVFGADWKVEG